MHAFIFPSLILTLLIFETLGAIPNPETTTLAYPSRVRRQCCSYSQYPQASIKCGTIPCGSCCRRTPPPAYPTVFKMPPLPPYIPRALPPSPTAIVGCSVCG